MSGNGRAAGLMVLGMALFAVEDLLLKLLAVDDAGNLINPLIVEGQIHGGLAQGVGQAMLEEAVYNSLFMATTTTGNGATVDAIPLDRVRTILIGHGIHSP